MLRKFRWHHGHKFALSRCDSEAIFLFVCTRKMLPGILWEIPHFLLDTDLNPIRCTVYQFRSFIV